MKTHNDIVNIQKEYLKILESYFQNLWQKYSESGLSPIQFLHDIPPSNFSSNIVIPYRGAQWNTLSYQADQLLVEISSFWSLHRQSLVDALKTSDRLNTQIGDLNGMSNYYSLAVTRLGLYFDSICLLDPLAIASQRRETMEDYFTGSINDPQLTYLLLNYLGIRSLKPFLLSDTDLPIAILVPPIGIVWGDETFKYLQESAEKNAYRLFGDAFDRDIDSLDDLVKTFETNSLQQIEKKFKEHTVLKELLKTFNSLDNMIKFSASDVQIPENRLFSKLPLQMRNMAHIKGIIEGRFLALEGAETSAAGLGIDINIPNEHWEFNKYRIEGNSSFFATRGLRDEIPVQAAIMSEKMNWMLATTVADLVKLRENGFMEQIREIYRVNRLDLQRSSIEDLDTTASIVVNNVTEALQNYQDEIEAFKQKSSKGWFNNIIFFFISGSLGIASLFFPPLGLIGTTYSLLGPGASITDFVKKYIDDKNNQQAISNRPIFHMLEIWERGTNE
ncbi:MAG: hypothetical protein PVF83_05855 [Anaerolineales bacterium]|jgi:hypothetical protein